MIWAATAVVLIAWFGGLLILHTPVVNLLLIVAAALLVVQLINDREREG